VPKTGTRLPTTQEIVALKESGSYKVATCTGLTVEVSASLSGALLKKRWMFRFVSPLTGRQREAGLGAFPATSLADALTLYREYQVKIARGICPLEEKHAQRQELASGARWRTTFWEVVEDYLAANSPKWAPPQPGRTINREEAFWRGRFANVVAPIARKPIADLTKQDVAEVLRPIYDTVSVCDKIQKRIHAVFERAIAQDRYEYANPAARSVVEAQIRIRKPAERRATHRPSVHWHHMPIFWRQLTGLPLNPQNLMLRLLILTGFRGIEIRRLKWADMSVIRDPYSGVLTVATARTNKSEDYKQPLVDAALQVLDEARRYGGRELVFPSENNKSIREMPFSENALMLYAKKHFGDFAAEYGEFTVHGFRSTLETWASEAGSRKELVSALTGHFDRTEYNRSEFLSEKMGVLQAYQEYLSSWVRS
jgi:integrase